MYRSLDADKVVETADRLSARIVERFPASGLSKVAAELAQLSRDTVKLAAEIRRPIWPIRAGAWILIVGLIGLLAFAISQLSVNSSFDNASELAQGIESFINDIVFVGIAIFFLLTIETRIKRRRVLRHISQFRSIAHVIDMHQLTKDPERVRKRLVDTTSSPAVDLTPVLLSRYLDYCSEMLSVLGKLAAICVQRLDDAATLAAVNDIEDLTTGLSRKIWQKIMIIDRLIEGPNR